MDRKQAKELLPIIQGFAEGKIIQNRRIDGIWIDLEMKTALNIINLIDEPQNYRIKPEPQYRSFKDTNECWEEMLKHQPFGWVCRIDTDHYKHINSLFVNSISFQETEIAGSGNFKWTLPDLFKCYTFADGTPFGIKD